MWIENISLAAARNGDFPDPGENSVLIQILDDLKYAPAVPHNFKIIKQFQFCDVCSPQDSAWDYRITYEQAQEIADTLILAKQYNMNVVVHCVAGLCRSGAVTEVGLMMGFDGGTNYRNPNVYVKQMLMACLGLATSAEEYSEIFENTA
jgi:predicted protein tyrosine phosphatase